jgi:phosphonate dehydrogenase
MNMVKGGRPKVLVTHWVHTEVIDALADFACPVAPSERDVMPREQVLAELGSAAAVMVCMADHVNEEFLQAGPQLRIVSAALKGYDNIDLACCTRRRVWLTVLPNELTESTAELALALILGIIRRIGEGDRQLRSGAHPGWRPRLYGTTLAGSTVGIIGMGSVGQALARLVAALGAQVLYTEVAPVRGEPRLPDGARRATFADLLTASDVVVPLVPLTSATKGMVGAAELGQLPQGSYLVNVCRGSVVDEEAVSYALEAGHLAGYAADVFALEDREVPGRPAAIPPRLLRHPRTLFTPHLGTAVDDVRRHMSLAAVSQVHQALEGHRPSYAVNDLPV